jgi:spoIIIJ-associated protein
MADPSSAQVAQQWLSQLLNYCSLDVSISITPPDCAQTRLKDFGGHWLTLDSQGLDESQLQSLMGEKGVVLDAMQYLVNATLNLGQDSSSQAAYTVELLGRREQRYLELAQMADDVAAQVRGTGEEVAMMPLPPAERRLIHTILGESEDLQTYSRGQEPQRCLVVGPKQPPDASS